MSLMLIHAVLSILLLTKSLPMAVLVIRGSTSEGRAVYLLVGGGVAGVFFGGLGFIAGMLRLGLRIALRHIYFDWFINSNKKYSIIRFRHF